MGQAGTSFCTLSISGAITINEIDSVTEASIIVTSGTVTILGSRSFKGTNSNPITLSSGQSLTLSSKNGQYPLDGLTIDATGGGADVVLSF